MHQERSVLGCTPLLHRISFFGRAMRPGCQVTSVVLKKKTLKLYKLLCALKKNFQNIERKFTFTRKRTDSEERNEIPEECHEVSLSDSKEYLSHKGSFRDLINY